MSEIQEWHRELALRVADMAYLIYDRGEAEEDEDARLIADEFDKRLAAEKAHADKLANIVEELEIHARGQSHYSTQQLEDVAEKALAAHKQRRSEG